MRIAEVREELERLRTAAVGADEREARVVHARLDGVLAHAALSRDRHLRLVDLGQRLQKVAYAHRSPGPRGMR